MAVEDNLSVYGNKHMKNNNTPNIKNQVKFKIADHPAIKELKTQPVKSLEQYSNGTLDILNYIILLLSHFGSAFPKQQTIASRCDLTREHVNRCISRLRDDGLLDATAFNNHPNTYRVAPEFFQWDTIEQLQPLLPALKMLKTSSLALGILFSNVASGDDIEKKITHIKNSSSQYIFKNSAVFLERETFSKKDFEVVTHPKKEKYMKQFKQDLSPEFMKALDNAEIVIGLTPIGMKELILFPAAAIESALHEYKQSKLQGIRDRYRFFCSLCTKHCKELQLIPDYEIVKKLNLPKDAPRCEQLLGNDNERTKTSSNGKAKGYSSEQVKSGSTWFDPRSNWDQEKKNAEYAQFVENVKMNPTVLDPGALEFLNILEQNGGMKQALADLVETAEVKDRHRINSNLNGGE